MTFSGSISPISRIGVLTLTAALAACGSTSVIKPTRTAEVVVASPTQPHSESKTVDVSGYDKIVVLDYVDAIDKSKLTPDKVHKLNDEMAIDVHSFPDLIASRVRDTGAFHEVVRGPSTGKALIISGRITRVVDGSGPMRFWIGMGAGSSYFDATTDLYDAESGQLLGQITTSKNSWALGGAYAAMQTVESFMQGAADKIAVELRDSKQHGPALVKTN